MPCFIRERNQLHRPRRNKGTEREVLTPKPVRPSSIKYHGLFGDSNKQHLIVDENWTLSDLSEQYSTFTDLLSRRVIYKRHEAKKNRKNLLKESKRLKLMCVDGRLKLQKISWEHNAHEIRNILSNHKDMQRLYQKMPIHLVVDNINQRTFILRKERDRLEMRMAQCKHVYKNLLLDCAEVQNRMRYTNLFECREELQSRALIKKIENSNVRLKAIKTINSAYKKIIQVLQHDEIFYEPILCSLNNDIEDQANFIKYLLYLGKPAVVKHKELTTEYRQLQFKSRANLQSKIDMLSSILKPPKPVEQFNKVKETLPKSADPTYYLRYTPSMDMLKDELTLVEKTIKELKLAALCWQAREIYPSMKHQLDNNRKLLRQIDLQKLNRKAFDDKKKYAETLQQVLINNLSEEELNRMEHTRQLRIVLKTDDDAQQEMIAYVKNRGDAYIAFRFCLWNLLDILRHVDPQNRTFRPIYQSSYLKLPFLKFEMFNMVAAAPELYEEDQEKLMAMLKRKVYKLMKSYTPEMQSKVENSKNKYHMAFLKAKELPDNIDGDQQDTKNIDDDDDSTKNVNIPNRKQIKAQSVKVLQCMRREDET
ncbi:hypothetical protein KR222_002896 [Zaprionus bogoriensis]|nr:hypothetical protein KR222_002896 [Zaprionus bogoriensis]